MCLCVCVDVFLCVYVCSVMWCNVFVMLWLFVRICYVCIVCIVFITLLCGLCHCLICMWCVIWLLLCVHVFNDVSVNCLYVYVWLYCLYVVSVVCGL